VEHKNLIDTKESKIVELRQNLSISGEIHRLQNECKRIYDIERNTADAKIDKVAGSGAMIMSYNASAENSSSKYYFFCIEKVLQPTTYVQPWRCNGKFQSRWIGYRFLIKKYIPELK
jgi:hypothetical protein